MKLLILNGPNLNLLGMREINVYGSVKFEDYLFDLKNKYAMIDISYYQSNVEGELINKLHEAGVVVDGIIFNAGGYTHTSIALADAIRSIPCPVVEVHISNLANREEYRNISYMSAACIGTISGFGLHSYELAVNALQLNSEKC